MRTYANPYYLKYFIDAVELGGISASAQKNLVSHPAVSKAIRSLELQHQIKLLRHQKKSFEVTEAGYQFAFQARQLLGQFEKLDSNFANQNPPLSGKVSIGLSRSLGHAYLEKVVRQLESQYPNIQLEIRFGTAADLTEKLLQKSLDICLTIGKQSMPTLTQTKLADGNFVLIHSGQKGFTLKENLARFILTEPKLETELLKKSCLKTFNTPLKTKLEVGSWDMICDLVASGVGVGLVPDLLLQKKKNIKIISQSWYRCAYEIYLYRRNEVPSQLEKIVSDQIADVVKDTKI